ncbi:hypothetical protein [Confluentibacter flavum]|uniref:Cytochrome b561 bacterial/Ni-hydrogenase domain-containing protein n=1 Tax=Confluentibacter flavum TaxID=1909700 RepID=A0A2N3HMT4_9FLAO|nr:hypothetical protein [Confluentibacter flavum]PKQ46256.1 hypothetical protein CSW08_03590 [Confluentibacter flavum]
MLKNNKSTLLGLILLSLFFLQFFLKIEWTWLKTLQQDEMYKRWSGLGLALFITLQWLLTLSRIIKKFRKNAQTMLLIHKWAAALSPLLFYFHSMGFGYGYLLFFSYVFFSNTLLGYLNLDVIKNNSDWLFKGWMIAHVALSITVTIVMFFHIGVVFYYK